MNYKKIIIVTVVTSLLVILSVSYVHAQTVSFGSSNSTVTFGFSNSTLTYGSNSTIPSNSTVSLGGFSNSKSVPSPACVNNLSLSIHNQGLQINISKAILLASENSRYLSMMNGYNSSSPTIFLTGTLDKTNCVNILTGVNVGYVLRNQTVYEKSLVITLDPTLSKVTNVTSYVGPYYLPSDPTPNWSGYELSADGSSNNPQTNLTSSQMSYFIPPISQPSASANSKSCISPSIGCELATWTGLEDQFGANPDNHLVQGGTDENMTCTAIGSCNSVTYYLWFEFLPNPAFLCFNSNIKSGDSITDTVSNNGNGVYSISVVDNAASATCATIQQSYPQMTKPVLAPYINERAAWSASNPFHRAELPVFSDQLNGIIGFGGNQSSITTSMISANPTMINPQTPSGTKNISVSAISGGGFTQSYLSSDNTNTCFPPSGDWVVKSSCALDFNYIANANVIIQNNAVLTIPNGLALTLHFNTNHLLVNSGSGVLIQPGGKISN